MTEPGRLEPVDMAKVPFLRGLLPAQVEALCAAGTLHEHAAGAVVFPQGDQGQELHVLIAGEVAIELEVAGSAPRRLATLRPGSVFGEVGFLISAPRTATARALVPSRVLAWQRERIAALDGIGRQAAANLMETVARVLANRLTSVNAELAATCARLAGSHPAAAQQLAALDERTDALTHEWKD